MKYWPLSQIRHAMDPNGLTVGWEPYWTYKAAPPPNMCAACVNVARTAEPLNTPALVCVYSEDAQVRRLYLRYPETQEWLRLERGGVIDCGIGYCLSIDALH